MEVILAEHAGFCFGVKRAVDMLEGELAAADGRLPIFTWGPIIHNDEVVRDFSSRGVRAVESLKELEEAAGEKDAGKTPRGIVVIRAHGVPREISQAIGDAGFAVVDATCPFVKRIHGIVESAGREGRSVIVVGDPSHPEVEGIVSWVSAAPGIAVRVVETAEQADRLDLPKGTSVTVVAQTTFRATKFQEIVEIIRGKEYDVNIAGTICSATEERQSEAKALAARVDAMIVVGSARSSNTRKLYEICESLCPHTTFVHTPEDHRFDIPEGARRVGITAGASTPQKIIEEVLKNVRSGQEFH
ncbi:MAG: 4-hydroxy-3-methylbut-2-enyl diphosphate reductase [Lachnospiraceae bacterium]|nr:4-hydroxy-3-methylbut-2-enyl diphosphate reductase [Lachnospiraceae bacterium]